MKTPHLPPTIAVLFAIAMMRPAVAGNPLPGYYQDAGLNPFRSTANHNFDEHIDPFTGTLQLHHVDAVLPGNGGFDLTLQRSFNSPITAFGTLSDANFYSRTPNVGVGWSLLIGGRLYGASGSGGNACTQVGLQMVFETPDGSRQALVPAVLGDFQDFRSAARWHAVCVQGGVQVYSPNGTRYDMLKAIGEYIPSTALGTSSRSFLYPTQIVDRNGNSATLNYITVGTAPTILLNDVSTSDGRWMRFYYQQSGSLYLLSSVATAQGSWSYYYHPAFSNAQGTVAYLLDQVSPPAGSHWSYYYNSCPTTSPGSCSINQLTYPEGGSISYQYGFVDFNDGTGNTSVVASKSALGRQWSFSYSPGGSYGSYDVTTANTPLGIITYKHFGYRSVQAGTTWKIGLLAERNVGNAQTETYTWASQQISPYPTDRGYAGFNDTYTYAPLLTQRSISRGGGTYTTSYSIFDQYGNPRSIYESGNHSHTIARDYCINASKWIVNVPGTDTISGTTGGITRVFDGNCNLTDETRFGVHTGFTYDNAGNMASRTDANNRTTIYAQHFRGIPQVENRSNLVTINRTVDQSGNILSQTDGAGNTYQYSYDAIRRMSRLTPQVGSWTDISWTGNYSRRADRGGTYSETLSLDGLANPTSVTRSGISTSFSYDAFSNKTFESLPGSGSGTQFLRDILGRVSRMTNSDNSSRTFTYVGYSVSVQDERSNSTSYDYAAFGDPDKKFLVRISLPTGSTITINRDDLGNITSVSQSGVGGFTRSYVYNGSYFLTSITDPETGTTSFGRDAVGNMTSSTVGGRQTTYTYDGLNRLTHISYQNGNSVSISYYGNGRTQSITSDQATRTYNYDRNANLTSETLTAGGQSFTIDYTYNSNDALSTITYPKTGDVVSYSPDSLGRPGAASPFITSINHFASGNVSSMSYANGVSMSYGENSRSWPNSLRAGSFLNKSYTYDGVGNVSQISDSANPTLSMSMTYDNINEITTASGPLINASIGYDAIGNISSYTLRGVQRTYSYSSNKLTNFDLRSFGYDGYGNVTSDGLHTFQYDDASNLTCLDCPAIAYAYDGNNRRVSRTTTQSGMTVTTYYVHASNGDLLLEYTPSTNAKVEHIYVQGKRVATKTIP